MEQRTRELVDMTRELEVSGLVPEVCVSITTDYTDKKQTGSGAGDRNG